MIFTYIAYCLSGVGITVETAQTRPAERQIQQGGFYIPPEPQAIY